MPDTCCYTFAVSADAKTASRIVNCVTPFCLGENESNDVFLDSMDQAALTRSIAAVTNACNNGSTFAASFSSYA